MKKFLLSLLTLAATTSIVGAQENLLAGAIGTTVDNKEAFYNVWQVYDKDGNQITDDNKRMYSCFTQGVVSGSKYQARYNGEDHDVYGDHEAFGNGKNFIFMKFPGANSTGAPHYYAYPINIKEAGDYTLTVCGQGHAQDKQDKGEGDTAKEHELLRQMQNMAITFDKEVTPKEFKIESVNGQNEFAAYAGSEKVPVYRSKVGNSSTSFGVNISHTVHLTPEHKYMTIQAPACLLALGNLSLAKDGEVSINEFLTDDDTEPVFFDLQGCRAGTNASQLEKGIYIKKTGAKTEKVAIR